MLVVAVVMILVVGPKELPGMLRTIGKTVGNLRRMAGDFQRQFSDALKEADIDEVKKDLTSATSIGNPLDEINKSANDMMKSIDLDDDLTLDDETNAINTDTKIKETSTLTTKPTAKTPTAKTPRAKTSERPKKTVSRKAVANQRTSKTSATNKTSGTTKSATKGGGGGAATKKSTPKRLTSTTDKAPVGSKSA